MILVGIGSSSCSPEEERRVLVIHSYEDSYAGYPVFDKLIKKEFRKKNIKADLCVLYLDCESYLEKEELERMNFMLDSVANWKPEVIIVNEDQATYSLLKCGNPLVKQTPVVFAGVNYPNWELIEQYPNVTGFHDKLDFKANIEMARKLWGQDISFFSLLDNTFLDRKIRTDIKEQIKGGNIVYLQHALLKKEHAKLRMDGYVSFTEIPVRSASERSDGSLMWFLSSYSKDRCYIQAKRDFTTVNISNITSSPCLTAINEAFGLNEKFLGGYFTSVPTQVREEVDAATAILHGKSPADIPFRESLKEYMIDWRIMDQLNIPISKIPSEYTIINIPFKVKYNVLWWSIILTSVFLLLTIIICLIFLYRREQKRKKKALSALADEKETLALAIEGGNTYVWRMEGELFIFEKSFWQSLGMKARDLTIEDMIRFVHPDQRENFMKNWKNLSTAHKEIVQLLCDFNRKGYQWWEFRYTTTCTGKCRTAGLLLNIQAFKERERELEEARKLAEKAELKESFLANISHEIRTPLNAIVGFSTMLASNEVLTEEEKQDYIQTINHNNELLLKLISDVLELSRIKAGYMSFSLEQCRIDELMNNIYNTHQMLILPPIEFLKEFDENVHIEINIDKGRITQVIGNFLSNACKFTRQGYIKLGYKYIPERMEVKIYVEDTGQGIEPQEQKIIFNRFYKHDEFAQGTGLGLSICQSIVEKLNGRIELWSEPGKGSCFTIILPCKVIF